MKDLEQVIEALKNNEKIEKFKDSDYAPNGSMNPLELLLLSWKNFFEKH